jgi:outer membrane protein OmpA-like peptidoglycan-associated protein
VKMTVSQRRCLAAGAVVLATATAGCRVDLGAAGNGPPAGDGGTYTVPAQAALLVVVSGPAGPSQLAGQVISATARPSEHLDVLEAGPQGRAVASDAPAPVTVTLPARPSPLPAGASTYQTARYESAVRSWRDRVVMLKDFAPVRSMAAVTAWAHRLRLPGILDGAQASPAATTLPTESAQAASAASGQVGQAGQSFGSRRVVLLDVTSLAGPLPPGELDGDDVIVLTPYLPSQAAASAAQEDLLVAGASHAAVLGPEVTPGELDQLVSDGLSQHLDTEDLSGPALFANNSATLLASAADTLAPLVGPLSRPGACGVINGYASVPGSARRNQDLSLARAAAVARFLEARGVPATCLLVAGHGATSQFGSGDQGDNRRVVIVIEEPSG